MGCGPATGGTPLIAGATVEVVVTVITGTELAEGEVKIAEAAEMRGATS